jgi:hypothetical protein
MLPLGELGVMASPGVEEAAQYRPLSDKWVMWAHLPYDTNWSVSSYKRILGFNTLEDLVALVENTPDVVVKNCMLFLMRSHIKPVWEDPANVGGGCFSFKVANRNVTQAWKVLCYAVAGGSIAGSPELYGTVCGATISPKRAFCIVKVWLNGTKYQDPSVLASVPGLNVEGCIFKRHM